MTPGIPASAWRLTHEMVHLSFPDLDRRHIWMTEGVATYVESIARARAGQMAPETVWWWMVTGLPKGLPAAGDRGLDHTHTWGRTYWGGALYFFLADMQIRRRTDNRRSIDDALRAILAAGGDGRARVSRDGTSPRLPHDISTIIPAIHQATHPAAA